MAPGAGPAIHGRALGRARDVPGITQTPVLALTFHNTCSAQLSMASLNFLAAGLSKPAAVRESAPPSESGHTPRT
jgi:hypothetical protein